MLTNQPPSLEPCLASQIAFSLTALARAQEETLKRLTRMETRVVNLMQAHNLDRDGRPLRCGGTV